MDRSRWYYSSWDALLLVQGRKSLLEEHEINRNERRRVKHDGRERSRSSAESKSRSSAESRSTAESTAESRPNECYIADSTVIGADRVEDFLFDSSLCVGRVRARLFARLRRRERERELALRLRTIYLCVHLSRLLF
jgi:hypothetical protein